MFYSRDDYGVRKFVKPAGSTYYWSYTLYRSFNGQNGGMAFNSVGTVMYLADCNPATQIAQIDMTIPPPPPPLPPAPPAPPPFPPSPPWPPRLPPFLRVAHLVFDGFTFVHAASGVAPGAQLIVTGGSDTYSGGDGFGGSVIRDARFDSAQTVCP